jgi:hypothetical protein
MSDQTFSTLPTNRNDKENNRFGLDSDGKVGVRVLDATKGSDGQELAVVLADLVDMLQTELESINNTMQRILNHQRQITGIDTKEGDMF